MALSIRDIVIGGRTVQVGDTEISVRGICLEDIASLMKNHQEALVALLGGGEPDWSRMVMEFSGFVSALIALAADEPDAEDVVSRWPMGVQLDLLQAIWEDTRLDMDTLGKFLNGFVQGLGRVSDRLPEARPREMKGSRTG